MNVRTIDLPQDLYFPEPLGPDAVVGILGHKASETLAACDLDGTCIWQEQLDTPHQMGTVSHNECWLLGGNGLVGFAVDGTRTHEFELPLQSRERLGAIIRQDDALFVSIYRTKVDKHSSMAPRVIRTTLDGEIAWSTTLPVDSIAYEGCVHMGVATNWKVRQSPPWVPESWLPYGTDQLLASDNRVLAIFKEMPRSGIGCRYVLNAESGQLVWKSRPTPTANALALQNGKFLVGNQGYGAFETSEYEDNVESRRKWESHGHCLLDADGRLICLEMSNDMSVPQHLVQFLPNGSVNRLTDRLEGYYSSKPCLMADGRIYFWRADRLWSWSHEDGLKAIRSLGFGDGSYTSSLNFSVSRLGLNIRGPYREGGARRMFIVFEI